MQWGEGEGAREEDAEARRAEGHSGADGAVREAASRGADTGARSTAPPGHRAHALGRREAGPAESMAQKLSPYRGQFRQE